MITPEKLQTEPIVPYLTQEIISLCDDYIEFWEELKKAFETNPTDDIKTIVSLWYGHYKTHRDVINQEVQVRDVICAEDSYIRYNHKPWYRMN